MMLNEDVNSTFKRGLIYGKKGEIVKVISKSTHVFIVEGKSGRFPVSEDKLIKSIHK